MYFLGCGYHDVQPQPGARERPACLLTAFAVQDDNETAGGLSDVWRDAHVLECVRARRAISDAVSKQELKRVVRRAQAYRMQGGELKS